MKTLLIVEDEKMIRQGIHTMVSRSGVPVETIIECNNGEAAYEILKEQKIDVMFTDIRMPKMDGIELVKLAHALENPPLIAAVSGFDDFSYAVEMLRNGVREYILKPVEREKIAEILKVFEDELTGKSLEEEKDKIFGKQQLKLLITKTDVTKEELVSYEERYGSFFYKDPYVMCIFESGAIKNQAEDAIIVDNGKLGDIALLEESKCEEFLTKELMDSCVGISASHQGISELKEAYREALAARKRAFCIGKNSVYGEAVNVPLALKQEAEKLLDEQAKMQRIQLIGTNRTDELDVQWDKLFIAAKREHITLDSFCDSIEDFVISVVKIYRNAVNDDMSAELEKLHDVFAYRNIEEYREALTGWIMSLHEKLHTDDDTLSNKKLKQAVEYIEQNYDKDLNMAVVSNYISMNYSMLSYLFKQYTGTNFVTYLKTVRMKEAMRLLQETDLKVIDISHKVGYENEKHFMKSFKAEFGISPTEYRKNMQR